MSLLPLPHKTIWCSLPTVGLAKSCLIFTPEGFHTHEVNRNSKCTCTFKDVSLNSFILFAGRPCVDCHAFEFMQRALQDLKKTAFNLDARVGKTLSLSGREALHYTLFFKIKTGGGGATIVIQYVLSPADRDAGAEGREEGSVRLHAHQLTALNAAWGAPRKHSRLSSHWKTSLFRKPMAIFISTHSQNRHFIFFSLTSPLGDAFTETTLHEGSGLFWDNFYTADVLHCETRLCN